MRAGHYALAKRKRLAARATGLARHFLCIASLFSATLSDMPHDIDRGELKVGDRVIVECVVTGISPGPDYCNVVLQTIAPMYPSPNPTGISLNASQVRRVG